MRPRVKKSPSIVHGLGPLHASFIVRQVEQPLSASIPSSSLAVICHDCENAFPLLPPPLPFFLSCGTLSSRFTRRSNPRALSWYNIYIEVSKCKRLDVVSWHWSSFMEFLEDPYFWRDTRYANCRVRCTISLHDGVKINGVVCVWINPFLEWVLWEFKFKKVARGKRRRFSGGWYSATSTRTAPIYDYEARGDFKRRVKPGGLINSRRNALGLAYLDIDEADLPGFHWRRASDRVNGK